MIARLGDAALFYKVALPGGVVRRRWACDFPVRELKLPGPRVFLDLKMYDIGETVTRAVAQVARSGADFLTIHAMKPVMAAAVSGRNASTPGSEKSSLALLAVTVLTSFDQSDLQQMGYALGLRELVDLRVRQAVETGMDGVVCSPLEAGPSPPGWRVRE